MPLIEMPPETRALMESQFGKELIDGINDSQLQQAADR